MERINVRVGKQLKKELEAEAREMGVSPSAVVREAIEEFIRRRTPGESAYDVASAWESLARPRGCPPT